MREALQISLFGWNRLLLTITAQPGLQVRTACFNSDWLRAPMTFRFQGRGRKIIKCIWKTIIFSACKLCMSNFTYRQNKESLPSLISCLQGLRDDQISMFKITHCLLDFPMESTFTHPTCTWLRGHAYRFHQQICCTRRWQYAFTIRAVSFWSKLPAKKVNASSVKSFKTLMDAHCQSLFPEVPIPSVHADPRKKIIPKWTFPHTSITPPGRLK